MSPRAYCALQCAVPAILSILDRRGGSSKIKNLRPSEQYHCIASRPIPALYRPAVLCGCAVLRRSLAAQLRTAKFRSFPFP